MANIPGFPGYAGWDQTEAEADFRATGGAGKGETGGGGGGGGGGFQPISAADLVKLREQAYDATKAYYEKLATEAKGDFDTAVKLMTADYSQGVRQAKERLAFQEKYGKDDLTNALSTLGIDFGKENESLVDTLNKRGMAVYQSNPGEAPNVVQPTEFVPNADTTNYTFSSNLATPPQNAQNLGQGGTELSRLKKEQSLRAEAVARAKMQPLEQAGITYKQFTNPNSGFNPADPGNSTKGVDPATLGSSELDVLQKNTSALQTYRNRTEDLANQRSNQINNIASQAANTSDKKISSEYINQLQKELTNDFVKAGV